MSSAGVSRADLASLGRILDSGHAIVAQNSPLGRWKPAVRELPRAAHSATPIFSPGLSGRSPSPPLTRMAASASSTSKAKWKHRTLSSANSARKNTISQITPAAFRSSRGPKPSTDSRSTSITMDPRPSFPPASRPPVSRCETRRHFRSPSMTTPAPSTSASKPTA